MFSEFVISFKALRGCPQGNAEPEEPPSIVDYYKRSVGAVFNIEEVAAKPFQNPSKVGAGCKPDDLRILGIEYVREV